MPRKIFTDAKLRDTYARIQLRLNQAREEGKEMIKKDTPEDKFNLSKAIQTIKAVRL